MNASAAATATTNNDDWPYAEVSDVDADRLEREELRGADYDDNLGGQIDRRVRR